MHMTSKPGEPNSAEWYLRSGTSCMYALPPERYCPTQDHASAVASLKKLCALRAQSSGLPSACQFGISRISFFCLLPILEPHDLRVAALTHELSGPRAGL